MKLIVGLGNPGKSCDRTRHNVGFDVLEVLAGRSGIGPGASAGSRRQRFQGDTAAVTVRGQPALLLWPLTWMNLSGSSVLAARDFYKVAESDILVICDDYQLSLGSIRLRAKGSSGGQKGLGDILHRLGTEAIPRLRVGVGPLPPGHLATDFVLGRFGREERPLVEAACERAADAVEEWAGIGIQSAMNRFN
ncbi:MAG: aminoacyl-tRNA hydrolase [Planctomycetaceae bacterium]